MTPAEALALLELVAARLRDVREHPWSNGTAEALFQHAELRLYSARLDLTSEVDDLVGRDRRNRAAVEVGQLAEALGVRAGVRVVTRRCADCRSVTQRTMKEDGTWPPCPCGSYRFDADDVETRS